MAGYKKRILCVEDDKDACDLIIFHLSKYGVVLADSQASGLLLAKTEPFDLYIIDVHLTYGDGIELCQQLRAFDPHTPVVFCTGSSDETLRQRALSAGAQAYFVKPIDYDALQDTVNSLISKTEIKSIGDEDGRT
jgi:DNA-binding response OmpR family regulator